MIFEKQADLLQRKKALGWTAREVANIIGCNPGVASSKLNGFIVLTASERQTLEAEMSRQEDLLREKKEKEKKNEKNSTINH